MSSLPRLDALFGPQLPGRFDFTLLFEHAMMMLVPTGVAVLVTPFYLQQAAQAQRQVLPGNLLWAKLACGLALVAIQATNIALWHDTEYFRSKVTVAACAMSLVASICTLAIIFISHAYSLQPSAFLSVFFSITMLFDIAMARSYFLRDILPAIAALQVCVVLLKLLLVILEEVPKRSDYRSDDLRSTTSPETVSGFWNRSLFVWLNPILFFGWRNNFTLDNLPNIGDEFTSERLFDEFSPHWERANKRSRFALLFALLRTLQWQFAQVFLPRLCFIGLNVAQPFLVLRTVQVVRQEQADPDTANGLIGACALIYFGLSVTRTLFEHWGYRVVTSIRGILVVAIYDKLQRVSSEDLENAGAVTLMSTDVEGTEQIISLTYESWSCLIQVGVGIWVLYGFIGWASFLIVLPTLVTFIGSVLTGKNLAKARAAWNGETQKRVAITSNMLAQIKSVKSMGLSKALAAYIEDKRHAEIATSIRERYTLLWVFAFGAINFTVTPAVVFAGAYFWTRVDDPMSIAEVFAILAVLAISANPLITLFQSMTLWAGGFASIARIQSFLLQRERQDPREPGPSEGTADSEKSASSAHRTPLAIDLNDVSVTSPTTGPVLRQITLRLTWGALAMLWGPINAGKSTFMKLLLGEVELNGGTASVGSETISYCSQDSWVPNGTLQDTITAGTEFDDPRYRAVINACALDVDFAELPEGDQTKTGTGGCNLSGGQRQRLSLARAAYARNDTMVVDDMFSSVDPETAGQVFHRLLGPNGLVREWNCTVVMTTNRLELLTYADHVFQFTRDGRIFEQRDVDSDDSSVELDSSDDESTAGAAVAGQQASADDDPEMPSVEVNAGDNAAQDEGRGGDLSLYAYFLSSAGIPAIIGWFILSMIAAVNEWLPVIYLRIWFSKTPENHNFFIGYGAFSVSSVFFNILVGAYYFTFIFPKTSKEAHRKLLFAVTGATPEFLSDTDSGSLLNRFSQDISLVTQRLALLMNSFVFLTFTVLVEIGMIAAGSPYAVPIIVFILGVLSIIQIFYLRSSRQLRQRELEASASLFTHFTESIDGIHHIRSFGWQNRFRQKLLVELDRSQKPTYLLYCLQRWLTLSMDLTSAVASTTLVSLVLKFPDSTSDAAVGLAMLSLIGFSSTASGYIRTWTAFETSLGAVRRIRLFEKTTPQEEQPTTSCTTLPEDWPSAGKIDFNAVTATYRTNDVNTQRALDNVTVSLRAGQKIGLKGRTGSGKSTMLAAILRMVNFIGSISIDGRDIRTVPHDLLRSRITTITQDGLRLNATLRFNMYPFEGPRPSDNEMIRALQGVNLWPHANAHGGLDAEFSRIRFSAGQKQLLYLARAFLHHTTMDTKIVLLDEATSALSAVLDEAMQETLDEHFADSTVVIVSHRMESFGSCDTVLEFEGGRLAKVLRRRYGRLVEAY